MIAKPGQLLLLDAACTSVYSADGLSSASVHRAQAEEYVRIASGEVAEAGGPDELLVVKVLHVVRRSVKVES